LFLSAASLCGFTAPTLTRADVVRIVETHGTNMGFSWPSWITADKSRRLGRGHFSVPEITGGSAPVATVRPAPVARPARPTLQPIATVKTVSTTASVSTVASVSPSAEDNCVFNNEIGSMIPEKLSTYVSFGHHKDIESILKSGLFAPIFVTGLPGNGKTTMIEQVCASLKREYFRVNITALTDEEDLIGGFRLVNGRTVPLFSQ
jgi:AAA domain (dynein-related subfamily)